MISTFSRRFNVSIAVFSLLQALGTISIRIQQLILHTLNPIIVALIALIYWFFLDHPFAALCPLAGLVVYEGLMHVHRGYHGKDSRVVPAINDVDRHAHSLSMKWPSLSFESLRTVSESPAFPLNAGYAVVQEAVNNVCSIAADNNTTDEMKLMILETCLEKVEESLRQEEMLSGYDEGISFEDESEVSLMREALWYSYRLEESPVILPFVDLRGRRLSISAIKAHRRSQSSIVPEISIELSALRVVKQLYEYHALCVQDGALSGVTDFSEQCALTRDAAEIWRASLSIDVRDPEEAYAHDAPF